MADIVHSVPISSQPQEVYDLVSSGDGFKRWWAEDVWAGDGTIDLGFFNRDTVYRLRPAAGTAGSRAEWICETGKEWAGTRLIFEIAPAGKGTLLRFTHAGWAAPTDFYVSCNTVWGELMFRLKAAAEGKGRGPLFAASAMSY